MKKYVLAFMAVACMAAFTTTAKAADVAVDAGVKTEAAVDATKVKTEEAKAKHHDRKAKHHAKKAEAAAKKEAEVKADAEVKTPEAK